jgi:glucose-6-phosphate 1-dehydrogenase
MQDHGAINEPGERGRTGLPVSVATTTAPVPAPAVQTPADHVIVLFGATGDLARRKLLPGFLHLTAAGLMPERFRIIATSRHALSDEDVREEARAAIDEFGREPPAGEAWDRFAGSLSGVSIGDGLEELGGAVTNARQEFGDDSGLLHYLSLPPNAMAAILEGLEEAGLGEGARIILEKPFGTDLASARELNAKLHSVFDEAQIFRMDHYLGREGVQNLLAMRFANGMFEPVWNRNHIDHVQIEVPETLSIAMRPEFYDRTGAFRDMVVTHLFQVLSFVAMEPPTSLDAKTLMDEREKVFDAMHPLDPGDNVRGQYEGYSHERGIPPDSDTETFVALKAYVDNWRWAEVPFYMRTGKRLAESAHLLTLAFKQPPRQMFPHDCRYEAEAFGFDHLTFELGDPASISASFLAKVPGPTLHLGEAQMDFSYGSAFGGPEQALEPYERLLHDVMIGDRTLFTSSEGIERVWEVSQPVLDAPPPVHPYEPGSRGPAAAHELIAPRRWHLPGHRR